MHLSVVGTSDRISGSVQVPNSKYHAHRAIILASLADGASRISGLSDAGHVQHTIALLRGLGVRIDIEGTDLVVYGGGGQYAPVRDTVSAGSSGTTLYFMTGLAALSTSPVTVTGQKYFTRRPIGPLLDALRQMGIEVSSPNDCPPIRVGARRPAGGEVHILGTLSQWISGLLLLAPFATGPTRIVVDGPLNERSYIELTIAMMKQFGLEVRAADDGRHYDIAPNQRAVPTQLVLPPDIGSAAFGIAAAALHPANVVLAGLRHTRSVGIDHPEAELLDIVARMGLPMTYDERAGGVRIHHDGIRLHGTEIDCRDVPDMLPVLSAMAATADGETVFHNVEHVRLKESDRVVSMLQLNAMGGRLDLDGAALHVHGVRRLTGAPLSSFNDHRVLMSLAVAASAAEGHSTLSFPHAYKISYPMFLDAMQTLGLTMRVDRAPAGRKPRPVRGPAARPETAEATTGPAWVRHWAGEHPDGLALIDARWNHTSHLTWAELNDQASRVATRLLQLGVEHGERVAVQLPNWSEFVIATVAALRIGAVICPIMPIFRRREVETVLRRSGARVLITADNFRGRQYGDEIAQLLDTPPVDGAEPLPLRHVIVVHGTRGVRRAMPQCADTEVSWHTWHDTVTATEPDPAALAPRAPAPDDVAQLLFTSGTSGEPKGVEHPHRNLSRAVQMEIEHLGLGESDTMYIPSPLAHQTGFLYGMWLAFALGVPQIVQGVWNAHRGLEVLRGWQGTFVQAATPFLTDLVRAVEDGEDAPESLRIFIATGAAVPRSLAERATRVLGATVCGAFGTTETGLGALASPSDRAANAWGTDGRALPGVSLRIVDDRGRQLPAGVEGNLELTGPTVFDGYLGRPDLTAEVFTTDGWYRTGDLATLDDHGYLRITGRIRDVINRGGEKLPVSEIEQLLYTHPSIDDVAIVAMPDERLGERACAFVVFADGASLDFTGMQEFLDGHEVSKHYWPERLEPIDALPRNAAGKVQKFLLKERASTLRPQHVLRTDR